MVADVVVESVEHDVDGKKDVVGVDSAVGDDEIAILVLRENSDIGVVVFEFAIIGFGSD